jgi:hypothetical protein
MSLTEKWCVDEDDHPVLHQCGLEQDLSLWPAGDKTEVGEKGVTLRYSQAFSATL